MYELPKSVIIDSREYHIRADGDYRLVLDCFNVLEDPELTKDERLYTALLVFYDNMETFEDLNKLGDIQEALNQMFLFFNCGQTNTQGAEVNHKVIDWEQDSLLICSAINNVARTEIRALPFLHWWTFMGYYYAVGECALSTVVSIRHKIVTGKKLESYEKEFKKNNPQYFTWRASTSEKQALDEYVKSIWNQD